MLLKKGGTLRSFRRHLAGVPMASTTRSDDTLGGGGKVSSERPQSDCGTGGRNVKNNPKVTVGKSINTNHSEAPDSSSVLTFISVYSTLTMNFSSLSCSTYS